MKRLLPLALLLAGCNPSTPEPSETAHPTPPASTPEKSPPTTPPRTEVKAGTNPSRINQLSDLKKVDLSIKGHPVHLWVMDDEGKQQEGMMFLTDGEVKPDEGMLFAFGKVQPMKTPDGSPMGFWMHNTLIPLDIVYLSPEGKVLNVAHGKVQDDTNLPAAGAFKNVIELKAGTAAKYGLTAGDTVQVPKL